MARDGREQVRLQRPLEGAVRQVRWPWCWWQTVPCGWSVDCETSLSSCKLDSCVTLYCLVWSRWVVWERLGYLDTQRTAATVGRSRLIADHRCDCYDSRKTRHALVYVVRPLYVINRRVWRHTYRHAPYHDTENVDETANCEKGESAKTTQDDRSTTPAATAKRWRRRR